MKIALLLPGGVDRSGVDRVIPSRLWLIERLARRHEVHVFASHQEPEPGTWELLGARVHCPGARRGTTRRLLSTFAELHDTAPFDVIHAFFGPCGVQAALLRRRHRVPVVFHPSGGEFVDIPAVSYGMRRTMTGRLALRFALSTADRVTVSSAPMQELAARQGVTAERIPIGVALDRWPVRPPTLRDVHAPLRLLHVGDLRAVKDQQTLIDAAARLRDDGIDLTLDVVGLDTLGGAHQASPTAQKLGDAIRWHGVLRREPLRALMERADLLVVSSLHEAGPLVVLEAAVAGVPTVGTAVGHVAEWAPDAAVSVPVGDATALARAIAALHADEPRRLRLALEAQRRAVAIDADYTAQAFERIYMTLRMRVAR